MAGIIEPRKLKGFRDYPPELLHARESLVAAIAQEARLAGFDPISTPALEYSEVLLGQGGEETDKQVYRFRDHGDRDVALRYDLTVPFARFVAEHQGELTFPFKKFQIGTVWRGENPQKGRYREFMQCDLDIVGTDSLEADVEILFCFHRVLARIGFGAFTISLGNRPVLSALIRSCLPDVKDEAAVLIALDKLAKIGRDGVRKILTEAGHPSKGADGLLEILEAKDGNGDTPLEAVRERLADSGASSQLDRFEETVQRLRELGQGMPGTFRRDLSIARGLGYYTGLVFETTVDDLPGFGSISSGGRYDNLVSRFTKRELPGVGGSLGVDRLLAALEELKQMPAKPVPAVLVAAVTADARAYAFSLVKELREAGVAAEIGLQPKAAQQFKYANRRGCRYVVAVGTDEASARTVSLKEMATGEETRGLPRASLLSRLVSP